MKTTLPLLTALLLTPITGLQTVDPKPAQRSVVTDEPQRHVGRPEGAADYVAKSAPTDGQHLALTLKKLEHGFDPPRPFLIWALGSSYTNMLGGGEPWKQEIPKLFPNAPEIRYEKMVGNSCPWQYLRGWARHLAVPDQPDLVISFLSNDSTSSSRRFGQVNEDIRKVNRLRNRFVKTSIAIICLSLFSVASAAEPLPDTSDTGDHSPSAAATIFSDDHGRNWKAGDLAVPNEGDFNNPNETMLATLSDDSVMLVTRSVSKSNRKLITISSDGATGWSKPVFHDQLWEPVCMAGIVAHPSQPGTLIFSNPHSLSLDKDGKENPAGRGKRENLCIKLSRDDGKTWPVNKVLDPGKAAYSDLAVLPDGTVL